MKKVLLGLLLCVAVVIVGCNEGNEMKEIKEIQDHEKQAIFAGGCFWCTEAALEKVDGVSQAISGFSGGTGEVTYNEVASGATDHREVVLVVYDPVKVEYRELVEAFFKNIDPTDSEGQFADRGYQYSPAIYYYDEEQREMAEAVKREIAASGKFDAPIVVEILPATQFYPAEEYHQDFYKKNPVRYKAYAEGSGRLPFIRDVWG